MKNLALSLSFIALCALQNASAQVIGIPLSNENAYHILDRWDISGTVAAPYHSALKAISRRDAAQFAMLMDSANTTSTPLDRADIRYMYNDNSEFVSPEIAKTLRREKPLFGSLYRTAGSLWELDTRYFDFRMNPLLQVSVNSDRQNGEIVFHNQRGVEVRGSIDDKLYFYTSLIESQSRFPDYVVERVERDKALPGATILKPYNSNVLKITDGYDYNIATGYIGFNFSKHIGMQFGHGSNFIGNGYRSLFLSNFAANYLYLKLNTQVWQFQYQNIFAELAVDNGNTGARLLPKKYVALHHLSYNITPRLNVGIFEGIVFSRPDHFEFQYLNPVIFYRSIEGALGSSDNAMLGADIKYNFGKKYSLYGQFMLDEFVFGEVVTNNRGWWANKYGLQLGLKAINLLNVDHLDGQVEYNVIRPYTYSHFDSTANYSTNAQPLAHPLGANLQEIILKLRYQPTPKWVLDGRLISTTTGDDPIGKDYGSNVLIPYTYRANDYGNFVGQGVKANILLLSFDASYQFFHNMFLDIHVLARKKDSDDATRNQRTFYVGGGVRVNLGQIRSDY